MFVLSLSFFLFFKKGWVPESLGGGKERCNFLPPVSIVFLRIMYTSLPFFIYFYYLLFFLFFFCAQGGFLAFQIRADIFANYSAPEIFSRSYRVSPNNFIVRHVDRRLRGRDEKGNFTYSPDFTNAYYHPITFTLC